MKYFMVIFFLIILSGCIIDADVEKEKQIAMKACVDNGGVPIMSVWANVLADCKYPPNMGK